MPGADDYSGLHQVDGFLSKEFSHYIIIPAVTCATDDITLKWFITAVSLDL
jgi:hypothetical protein